jgi:hypothetical protein
MGREVLRPEESEIGPKPKCPADFLGLSLAEEFDCRDLGLLYYVMASSDTYSGIPRHADRHQIEFCILTIGPRFSPAQRSAPSAQARMHDACSVGRNF